MRTRAFGHGEARPSLGVTLLAPHATLVWLEHNVRRPLEGSAFDVVVATPLKELYCGVRKQS